MHEVKKVLTRIYPTIKELLIILAMVITIVFNYLAAPIREDLRTTKKDVKAVEFRIDTHTNDNKADFNRLNDSFNKINENLLNINTRLSRIEGKLEK